VIKNFLSALLAASLMAQSALAQTDAFPSKPIRIIASTSPGGLTDLLAQAHPQAPKTVAAFLKLLPYRQKFIHVRWSGEGVWVPLGEWSLGVSFESHTSHPSVGDILFYPGGYSETEIIMAYGACCFASKLGQLAGNHFLTITEGRENLRTLGVKVLWEGAQDILFEAIG
jgi:hypothetical protein